MNISLRPDRILNHWTARALRHGAGLAFLIATSGSFAAPPDPLLAAGEEALVGSYKLDNVLLAPGKVILLPNWHPMFEGMGDTPDQASQNGLLNARQVASLQNHAGTMTFGADHTFTIANLPSADLNGTVRVAGTWSMQIYHVFDTYGYRISLKCGGNTGPALRARFINGDKPNPSILEVFYDNGQKNPVMFRFTNTNLKIRG
jgi:hypothetical protein